MIIVKFGDVLRNLLEQREITQKKFANDLNIVPSTIGGYIQNKSEPNFETLKQIAKYFDVSIDYLLDYRTGNNKITHEEDDLLRAFRSLTDEQRYFLSQQNTIFVRMNKGFQKLSEEELKNLEKFKRNQ